MFAGNVQVQLFITDVEPVTKQVQVRKLSLRTYAVVANLAELSPAPCVVAVVPFGSAGVPLRFAAVPLVFAAFAGISPLTSAGSCACGSVPAVMSLALTVTFADSAWPFTVTVFGTSIASADRARVFSTATAASAYAVV